MKKLVLFLLFASPIMAQDFLPLYPAGIPNSKPVVNKQKAIKQNDLRLVFCQFINQNRLSLTNV